MNDWLKQNSWNIIVTAVGIIVAWSLISFRVSALEIKVNKYPSADYFELKFQEIDNKLIDIKTAVEKHVEQTR